MSAIAGTNYYTQFGYLLEGVKEGADGAASTWTSLTEAFDNSDGALMNMANQMNDTLPADMAIFNSAVDDAKDPIVSGVRTSWQKRRHKRRRRRASFDY